MSTTLETITTGTDMRKLVNVSYGRIHLSERTYPVAVGEVISISEANFRKADVQDALGRGWLAEIPGSITPHTVCTETQQPSEQKEETTLLEDVLETLEEKVFESIGESVVELVTENLEVEPKKINRRK